LFNKVLRLDFTLTKIEFSYYNMKLKKPILSVYASRRVYTTDNQRIKRILIELNTKIILRQEDT